MSKLLQTLTLASITCFAFSSATIAQDKSGDKLGEYDEIVIKRNTNKDGKVTIEIKDGNVLVDGEKMDAYKDGDISVYRRRIRPVDGNTFNFAMPPGGGGIQLFNEDDDGDDDAMAIKPGKAVLGVFTEKKEAVGVTVREVAKGTPAEKAGLLAGDVITKVDADKINEPKELFEKIGAHDPGDKVTITYLRDKKKIPRLLRWMKEKEKVHWSCSLVITGTSVVCHVAVLISEMAAPVKVSRVRVSIVISVVSTITMT
ncbi:PDZ domain-containing protein [Chitinophaga pinensis]|nr:PDZ domain-containing protein [Chitinophaga pinensis]